MTQLGHCVLAKKILGPVLSGQFISTGTCIGIPFFNFLVRPFPLEHRKLMFLFMIMLMILMLLVGTKLNRLSRNRSHDKRNKIAANNVWHCMIFKHSIEMFCIEVKGSWILDP